MRPAPRLRLSEPDRTLLALVGRAVVANPFGEERERLDAALAGERRGSPEETLEAGLARVAARIRDLERDRPLDPSRLETRDRPLARRALLFDIFYRFGGDFEALIARQLAAGAEPLPVPFAPDALGLLAARGFAAAEAARIFALLYQLRRAYRFIARGLIGRSACMRRLRESLWNNVFTRDLELYDRHLALRMEDFSTLLLGETGTGKGAAAAAIGRSGFIPFEERKGRFAVGFPGAFVALNLAQFPESLIESELFGHRKGAFTGAVEAHEGVLARCSPHGAIFLDEIGEVSAPVQVKLLRVLQERAFSPVGSHEPRRFHGRVIAATNRPIEELRGRRLLRDDLFYRLSSDVITVPTLRRRLEEDPRELGDLLAHAVERLTDAPAPELCRLVERAVARDLGPRYGWPGNVRELEQCVRRVLLTGGYGGDARGGGAAAPDRLERLVAGLGAGALDARGLLAGYCALLHDRHGTYEEVSRRTGLDRRTVRKHVAAARRGTGPAT